MSYQRRIRRRKRFFIGCEGESERSYATLLGQFAEEQRQAIHIDSQVLCGGDPLTLVKKAVGKITRDREQNHSPYAARFLMFDTDLMGRNPAHDREMKKIANESQLILIRQKVCIESFLLRHFIGHENDNPLDSSDALKRLQKVWGDYRKGIPTLDMAKHIQPIDVQRAANNPLNSDLQKLLSKIGVS